MNTLRACWRLTRVAAHLATGLATITFVFPRLNSSQKQQRIQAWAHGLFDRTAIKLIVNDQPESDGPVLLAANHISWLDVYVILAMQPCRFVAKSEVRHWPLVGKLAAATGTLFISRQSPRDAVRVVHQMTGHMQAGDTLAIFPEGTTSNGQQVLPFHANLFQAAISANVAVQPMALHFEHLTTGQHSLAPCYIDQDSLLGSLWRTLCSPDLCAKVDFGLIVPTAGHDRKSLSNTVHAAISALKTNQLAAQPCEATTQG